MMLRTHFQNSQFIVVSLKEGMFNNANVIFRTKFVDGVSAVTRTVAGGARNKANAGANLALTNKENSGTVDGGEDVDVMSPEKKRGKTKKAAAGGAAKGKKAVVI